MTKPLPNCWLQRVAPSSLIVGALLLAELVRVVDETLQPEHVSVWLRKQ